VNPIKIAIATYGHTAALKSGAVPIAGVQPEFVEVQPIIAAFRRMVRDVEFDVCEMAPATYMIAREAGSPFKALPVSIYRRFHHAGFVVRGDSGIRAPKDLEGRKAGVRAWSVTTGIWTRGILQNEYGVELSRVRWVTDDEEHVKSIELPPNVEKAPAGRSLIDLMAAGEIQAAFTDNAGLGRAGAPTDGWLTAGGKPAGYQELFPDAAKREAEWFRKTGIYPMHGVVVIKDELLARAPWVAKALFDAFVESKARYLERLAAPTSHSPRDRAGVRALESDKDDLYRQMAALVGDPLPYGLDLNRPALDALILYCHQQGLLRKRYAAEEMFINL
jgi:4,5-dihydroxyphthalate decarboxylase